MVKNITIYSVPAGAVLGLLIALSFSADNTAILIGTIVGGFLGGVAGLYYKQQQQENEDSSE